MTEREYARVFADNLNRMLRERDLSQREVAEAIVVLQQTFNKWCVGAAIPRMGKIEALCRFFHCNKSDLLEGHDRQHSKQARRVPVYGTIPAGIPLEAIQDVLDWEEIPAEWSGDYMALQVKGDSMSPAILSGDVVVLKCQQVAENGQIAAVYVNGFDATLKKVHFTGESVVLQPLNPAYETTVMPAAEVKIIGVVVELRRKF